MILSDLVRFPYILNLPEEAGECLSDIQWIETSLGQREFKRALSGYIFNGELPTQDQLMNTISELKWDFIRKDLLLLAEKIEVLYHQRLKELGFNLSYQPVSLLYQIVEIPWTLQECTPSSSAIRYKILTKREIAIR